MYPYELFFGIDLYTIMITLGVVVCLLIIRLQGDARGLGASVQNFVLFSVPISVVVGFLGATLLQSFYDYLATDVFEFGSGATFYGGLLGGIISFVALYFGVGQFRVAKERRAAFRADFWQVLNIAPAAITVAHGFGRLGCLFAGCCHGGETDAWCGILMVETGKRVVPIQLFEALFLFALCAVLVFLNRRRTPHLMPLYCVVYGVWRFLIEYARADDRGATVVDFLSPSQLFSLLLFVVAAVLFLVERAVARRQRTARGEGNA